MLTYIISAAVKPHLKKSIKCQQKGKPAESRKEMPAESTLQRNSESSPAPTPRSDQEGVVMTLVQKMKSVEDSVMG